MPDPVADVIEIRLIRVGADGVTDAAITYCAVVHICVEFVCVAVFHGNIIVFNAGTVVPFVFYMSPSCLRSSFNILPLMKS